MPICKPLIKSADWISKAAPEWRAAAESKDVTSLSTIRTVSQRLDAGGTETKRIKDAFSGMEEKSSITASAIETYKADLFSVSSISGVDLVTANLPESQVLATCQQIGDEFYGRKIDPLSDRSSPKARKEGVSISLLILPVDLWLEITNSSKNEFVFEWTYEDYASR